MSWIHALRYRLRTFFRRGLAEAEREEEIRFHLALEEMQQGHEGLEPDEARLASTRRFGNVTGYRQEIRCMSASEWVDAAVRQVRVALRGLRRSPGFAIAAVLTLGLGIGAVTAIGSLVYTVLLRPLPYPAADRLVGLWQAFPKLSMPRRRTLRTS
jgi:putative ABC transport system permease protein